jgi:uncharacterized protein (TIGR01777 family)
VSGASGFIGTELCRQLEEDGHTVLRLVRRQPRVAGEFNWAPSARIIDSNLMESVDAVINLAGAPTGRLPWTASYKKTIVESRLTATHTLTEAMNMAANPPEVFLSASAVGFYGDRPGVRLTEHSPRGDDFLAHLAEKWEQAARLAPAKTRVVSFRSGHVLGPGGLLAPLKQFSRWGLGVRMGTGGQHWPWISLYDEAAAIRHLLNSKLSGPVNVVGPYPATSDRITRALARQLHRAQPWVAPEWFLKGPLGEGGKSLLLPSQKVIPARLVADGFSYRHGTVESAIEFALAS